MPSQPTLPAPGTRQTLTQSLYFEYIMIRPTSASKKIYSRQTLGLPFHCLKLALFVGGKKKKQGRIHNKPLLTQVVDALYNRNQSLL